MMKKALFHIGLALLIVIGVASAQIGGGGISSGGGGGSGVAAPLSITLSSGCTTTPAETVNTTASGSTITLYFTNEFTCASNSGVKSFGVVIPTGLRPVNPQTMNGMRCTDNGTNINCCVEVLANGTLRLGINTANANNCAFDAWTSSGNFGVLFSQNSQQGGQNTFTYSALN